MVPLSSAIAAIAVFLLLIPVAWAEEPQPGKNHRDMTLSMDFAWIEPGCFEMGCQGADCPQDQTPAHRVCLDGFWIAQEETTQGQWRALMDSNPSEFKIADNYPVERVSWNQAREFAARATVKTGRAYRLPTEAEWEYLCRAGEVDVHGPPVLKSDTSPTPVDKSTINGLGLSGVGANVAEWTADSYLADAYAGHERNNPYVPGPGPDKVYRGDCWLSYPTRPRCGARYHTGPDHADSCIGFRLALSPTTPVKPDARTAAAAETANVPSNPEAEAAPPQEEIAEPRVLLAAGVGEVDGNQAVLLKVEGGGGEATLFTLEGPPRLVADLPGRWTTSLPKRSPGGGTIKALRVGVHENHLRVVADLSRMPGKEPVARTTPKGLALIFPGMSPAAAPKASPEPFQAETPALKPSPIPTDAPAAPVTRENVLKSLVLRSGVESTTVVLMAEARLADFSYYPATEPQRLIISLFGDWESEEALVITKGAGLVREVRTDILDDRLRTALFLHQAPGGTVEVEVRDNVLTVTLPGTGPGLPSSDGPAAPADVLERLSLTKRDGVFGLEVSTAGPVTEYSYAVNESPPEVILSLPGKWAARARALESSTGGVKAVETSLDPDALTLRARLDAVPDSRPQVIPLDSGLFLTLPGAAPDSGN